MIACIRQLTAYLRSIDPNYQFWSAMICVLLFFQKKIYWKIMGVEVMVFNATFNNISVISWQSVLLVEEIRVPVENHWPVTSH